MDNTSSKDKLSLACRALPKPAEHGSSRGLWRLAFKWPRVGMQTFPDEMIELKSMRFQVVSLRHMEVPAMSKAALAAAGTLATPLTSPHMPNNIHRRKVINDVRAVQAVDA